MFNCIKFLKDYKIDISTTGKNASPGWIQIQCPMPSCIDGSNHGGFNIESGFYNCWLCGKHRPIDVIQHLLNVSHNEANLIMRQYQNKTTISIENEIKHTEKITYPIGTEKMKNKHHKYLISRRYDSKKIEHDFLLKGTNYIGDYKFRIICPIFLNGVLISYQGRDITEKSDMRYKACSKEDEVRSHKKAIYNIDNANKDSVIIVEGITDVWRLGKNAISTFGIKYTMEQVYLIARKYNRVFIMFDPGADMQAEQLGNDLSGLNVEAQIIYLEEKDPGELSDEEAVYINNQLIGG